MNVREFGLWDKEFPFLSKLLNSKEISELDLIKVKRLDEGLLEESLETCEYLSSYYGDKVNWTKGWIILCDPKEGYSFLELQVGLDSQSASGESQKISSDTIGRQLGIIDNIAFLKAVVIMDHDDGSYNDNDKFTTLVVYKVAQRGTQNLLDAYWKRIEEEIHRQVLLADVVE